MHQLYHPGSDEDLGKRPYDIGLFMRLGPFIRPFSHLLLVGTGVLLLAAFFQLLIPYIIKMAIDGPLKKSDLRGLDLLALLFIGAVLCEFTLRYFQVLIMEQISQGAMLDLRQRVFSHLQRMPMAYFDKNPLGKVLTRVINDIESLEEMFASGVVSVVSDILVLIGIVAVMFYLNWSLALILLTLMPPVVLATYLFRHRASNSYRLLRAMVAKLNAYLQENIRGMATVQLFNRQAKNFQAFDEINRAHQDAFFQTVFYYAIFFPFIEVISSLSVAMIVWFGGLKVWLGVMTLGSLVAFIEYLQRLFNPIRDLSEKYNIFLSAAASCERIFELLDTPGEPKAFTSTPPVPKITEGIEFRDVSFAYDSGPWILKDVSFTVLAGERVAIVGATGSGKSTIVSLLCDFYRPQRGQILIDGRDIKNLDLPGLMALVPQEIALFNESVEANIRRGRPELTDGAEEVRRAAHLAMAHSFIEAMPEGYGSEIGEAGSRLSMGQKQLLTLSRAIIRDAPLLVLDEATSCVDAETEALFHQGIEHLLRGKTAIIVAHRLSTIHWAQRVIFLQHGEIKEQGTHHQLLAQKGLYYRYYQLQLREEELARK